GVGCQPGPQTLLATVPVPTDTGGVYWAPHPWTGMETLWTSITYQEFGVYTYNFQVLSGKCVAAVMAIPGRTYTHEFPLVGPDPGCPNCGGLS
ncbi:MAG: hypothetical protein ACPGQL_08950, partial [Thermoplasmatota archaeon]